MPRKHVEFPKFVDGLHAAGVEIPAVRFLQAPQDTWAEIPSSVRRLVLEALGLEGVDADAVTIALRKRAGAPKRLKNVFVVLEADAAGDAPAPAWDADADAPPSLEMEDESAAEADAVAMPASPPPAPDTEAEAVTAADPLAVEWSSTREPSPDAAAAAPPEDALAERPAAEPDAQALAETAEHAVAEPPERAVAEPKEHAVAESADAALAEREDAPPAEAGDAPPRELLEEDAAGALAESAPPEADAAEPEGDADALPDGLLAEAAEEANAAAESAASDAEPDAETPADADAGDEADGKKSKKGAGLRGLFRKKKADADAEAEAEAEAAEAASNGPPPGVVVTEIPPLTKEHLEEVDRYPVQAPYAFIRVVYDNEAQEHLYEVIEPALSERERNVLEFVEDTLVDVIDVGANGKEEEEAAGLLRKHVDDIIYDYSVVLSPIAKEKILYYILRDFLGFGILDPIMRDDMIEDVSCDGPNVPIFLYHRKYESLKSLTMFNSHEEADSFVIRMAQRSGKHISIAEPLLDATLPDGSRLNATLSDEVTANGSTFTIRKFKDDPFTAPDLVRFGTMSSEILAYWWLAVQNGASAIYAGGTASGKTTSLNAILLFIPPQMKIVSIEDTREINLPHLNWIPGVTRSGFGPRDNHGRQAGEIDMFTLLKAALRQRPEYILVGEVRGAEAYALFQAMATGHTAYGTMHADSVEAVIHRLESEPISIPRSLLEALDIVSIQIQTRIGDKRVRRTKEIVEVVGLDPHTREILTNEVFNWDPATDTFEYSGVSYVLERIMMERNMKDYEMREEYARRKEILELMIALDLRNYKQVAKVIVSYFKDPQGVLENLRRMKKERFGDEEEAGDGEEKGMVPVAPPEEILSQVTADDADEDDDWGIPEGPTVHSDWDNGPEDVPFVNAMPWESETTADGETHWRVVEGLPGGEKASPGDDADGDFDAFADPPHADAIAPWDDADADGDAPALPAGARADDTDGPTAPESAEHAPFPEDAATPALGPADAEDVWTRPPGLALPDAARDDADDAHAARATPRADDADGAVLTARDEDDEDSEEAAKDRRRKRDD